MARGDEIVSETPRLRLRRLRLSDIDDVAAMVADPEQMRFYPRPKTKDEVAAWLAWNLTLYEENGGTWSRCSTAGSPGTAGSARSC